MTRLGTGAPFTTRDNPVVVAADIPRLIHLRSGQVGTRGRGAGWGL
jgi:hypothetical protein